MFLSRSGIELNEIWRRQVQSLHEMDDQIRDLGRTYSQTGALNDALRLARAQHRSKQYEAVISTLRRHYHDLDDEHRSFLADAHAARAIELRSGKEDRGAEADEHHLHAIGLRRAQTWDAHQAAQKEHHQSFLDYAKAHDALEKDWGNEEKRRAREEIDQRSRAVVKRKNDLGAKLADEDQAWGVIAQRVHDNGGNAALANYKPRTQPARHHQQQMRRNIAWRNFVSTNWLENPEIAPPPDETGHPSGYPHSARIARARREYADAGDFHHPEERDA